MAKAAAEIETLQKEYEWLLGDELNSSLSDIENILIELCRRFQVEVDNGREKLVQPEKFMLNAQNGPSQVKCMVTLTAETINEADVQIKLNKQQQVPIKTSLNIDSPWRLQQLQDAGNYICQAVSVIQGNQSTNFHCGQQALQHIDALITSIDRGITSLTIPKKKGLEDLVNNINLKYFAPPLPSDTILSFYVQGHKLVMAVYQLHLNSAQKIDIAARHQAECSVPWLHDALELILLALQQCQILRTKVALFTEYENDGTLKAPNVNLLQDLA